MKGSTNTLTVRLAAQPTSDVTVNVTRTSGDTDLSVSGGGTLDVYNGELEYPSDRDAIGGGRCGYCERNRRLLRGFEWLDFGECQRDAKQITIHRAYRLDHLGKRE